MTEAEFHDRDKSKISENESTTSSRKQISLKFIFY